MSNQNAHAAQIDHNNVVKAVIVIPFQNDNDDEITAYCNSVGLTGRWIDTSYLGARRGRYAGIGYTFDPVNDVFIAPQPYGSWTLDENFDWQPPTPMPSDGKKYAWFEPNQQWIEVV